MNVYDFDGTIYKGDSTVDFFFYSLRKKPALLRYLPKQLHGFFRHYIIKSIDKTQMKENFYCFLKGFDAEEYLPHFWETHRKNIYQWYLNGQKEDDVIISASPEFLLNLICKQLGIKYLMASKVDVHTGKHDGINCHDEEKVRRLYEKFDSPHIDEFYSDSDSDLPLARLADKAFKVINDKPVEWKGVK